MFGHQDDQQYQQHDDTMHVPDDVAQDHAFGSNDASMQMPVPGAPAPQPDVTLPQPTNDFAAAPMTTGPVSTPTTGGGDTNELLDIKQQALAQLSPLVGHLEQTPEEKFRTTMMMIQASDNQALIKDAFAAAQAIGDEKTRAQALLDVINEINYFTHQNNQ